MLTTELIELPTSFTKSRVHSLYSDFRKLAESNPEGYSANIAAWKSALWVVLGTPGLMPDTLLLTADADLIALFDTSLLGTPLALDTVFDQLVKDGTLIPLKQFVDPARAPIRSSRPWWSNVPTPRSAFSWALSKTGFYDPNWHSALNRVHGTLRPERYVAVSCIDTMSNLLLDAIRKDYAATSKTHHEVITIGTPGGYTRSVYTKELFYTLYNTLSVPPKTPPYTTSQRVSVNLSETDLDVLLEYLSKDKPRLVYKDDTIKIDLSAEQVSDLVPISEKDRAVANMRGTIEAVLHRVDTLSAHITVCEDKARVALAAGRKPVARYALRSRRLAQSSQESALGMLANLETTLHSIDTATDNAGVMAALQSGIHILTNLNSEIGSVEKVAELVDELDEAVADTEEIGRQIGTLSQVDEDLVEDELQELLQEQQELQLPSVPTTPLPKVEEKEEELLSSQLNKIQIS
ncbi:uncharacterized protein SAPINGB_P006371 [Magnusiomyces paraingens]|uniref:Vacuolar-sorting protein SNF7 n=1 Tax=Magnusiomyces paraingens TaxID=2606893 RepID=A0A5E8C5S8_9ASCO|nr:uncharacterized protein SAPINGB_P006371 [Saprochaete ingens]VVT58762.1 unnamed protein product [Saprochaete ingens]